MAKKPSVTTISSGYASNTQLNNNFTALRDAFDNTLSLDGSSPNAMGADIDLNGNDLLNAGVVNTATLKVGGVSVVPSSLTDQTLKKEFETVAELLADTGTYVSYAAGDYFRVINGGFVYQVAASGASDQHVTTAGGVKLYVLPGCNGYDVTAFGASRTGANTTSAIQAAWAASVANDQGIFYPAGEFYHGSAITADLTVSGSPALRRFIRVTGQGSALTTLVFAAGGIDIIGAASVGVNDGAHQLEVSGVTIQQPSINRTTQTAIRATNMKNLVFRDVAVTGFLIGIDLEDVLVSQFFDTKVQYAGTGFRATLGNYSSLNVSLLEGCSFAACWTSFADVRGCNLKIDSSSFEGLGLDLSGDRGDYAALGLVYTNSLDGYVGLTIDNCYFENNKGAADIYIDAVATASYTIQRTNFNRVSSTRYTTSNVVLAAGASAVGSEQHAAFEGCGFLSAGTYSPNVARPKIDVRNTGGFNNWFVRADRDNVGLFSGADAYSLADADVKNAFKVPQTKRGTYTPVIEGDTGTAGVGTYTTQKGIYERIGDMVFFTCEIVITAHTGSGTFKVSLPPIAPDTAIDPPNHPISLLYIGPSFTATQQMCANIRPALDTTVGAGSVTILRMEPTGTLNGVVITNAAHSIFLSGFYRAMAA